jgi:hypothetical protein
MVQYLAGCQVTITVYIDMALRTIGLYENYRLGIIGTQKEKYRYQHNQ